MSSPTPTPTTTTNLPPNTISKSPELTQKALLSLLHSKCSTSPHLLRQAHALILRTGHFSDHYVAGTLLKYYSDRRLFPPETASNLFASIPKPNAFVWNTLINASDPRRALRLYLRMAALDSRPNRFTFPPLLRACSDVAGQREGAQIHAHVVKFGFSGDGYVRSSGIQMYASFGLLAEARRMLDGGGGGVDAVCFNAMINGYFKCGDGEAARKVFDQMPERNVGSWNVMITGFAKLGMVEAARVVFDEMGERDDISWSAMVDGYVKNGCYQEALEVFGLMQAGKMEPRRYILPSVLAACANVGALDQGRWIHAYARRKAIWVDALLGAALVDMYAKCGRLDMSWQVFENVREKEVFTWNAMIGGLAMHGRADDAVDLFEKMQNERVEPNGVTFVSVLKACAHAGWVDEGLSILDSMKNVFGIEPEVEHYGCVVDLFGRLGLFDEAEELIKVMPLKPNAAVWGALLGACRKHGNVELGEKVGKLLLELEPQNGGRYALLSNIYAKAGRFDDAAKVRKLMKERGVQTNPGTSKIDLNGTVHKFQMGDGSHPQAKEIYSMVGEMLEKLHTEGYSPDRSQVLFDIEEEEKESALQHHSEKLAIAFALINTKPGTTVRIVKNLRVCEDCHSATKLISRVYNREIVVRDRVRYHHFRNGKCSCGDFW